MRILDCTLRDGGYYNNWDFDQEVVDAYLSAVCDANIDVVELGLRNFPQKKFFGAFAYTSEEHIAMLDLPSGPIYGVMVDAKTILTSSFSISDAIERLFVPASESKINLVRVAAHFGEVEASGEIVKKLKSMGYIVGFNLMQAGGRSSILLEEKAKTVSDWGDVDVLYFADSLGNMGSEEVIRITTCLKKHWHGEIGIHTHDNMGKGLSNSITALGVGVSWLDSTITGMGRGAGNTQTENLLTLLGDDRYTPNMIYDLAIRYFEPLKKIYGWGSNLLYFLGARHNIHPTYIQNLLSNQHYGIDEVIGAIEYLSNEEGVASYSGKTFESALQINNIQNKPSSSSDISNVFDGKNILLIANGLSCKKYKEAIEKYIEFNNPIVISLNINEYVCEENIDLYILSHNIKMLSEFKKYEKVNKPLILPKHRFTLEEMKVIEHLKVFDIGFDSEFSQLGIDNGIVQSSFDVTAAYALGIMLMTRLDNIYLVGFDGFEKGDPRQQEMLELLNQYNSIANRPELISLTPTSYPIGESSIYALHS
ncbi:aldolase catalytic domain-containing protein [Vibrio sp. 99-8-1]|uniref:aldolase catalytic domain-containing protein n=1 Tax=Vibrio sp. 99-8-1 TaxID=2607602 RepID=UPI0014933A0A|nr:aldolase catalytic domain-containing protein [Vibrio sp. 99-8-1]NOI68722.1 pyruvate carboxyltransferase [Vibrio sp. 99-8-1]